MPEFPETIHYLLSQPLFFFPFLLLAAWNMRNILGFFTPIKPGSIHSAILTFVCFLAVSNSIFLGDPFNILFMLPVFVLGVVFTCRGTMVTRISVSVLLYGIGSTVSALLDCFPAEMEEAAFNIFAQVGRLVFWFCLRQAMKHAFKQSRPLPLPDVLWLLTDILALMPLAAVLLTVSDPEAYDSSYSFSSRHFLVSYLFLIFACISSVGLLVLLTVLMRQEQLRKANGLWEMRESYYRNMEQEHRTVRRLRHDMVNHLQTLKNLPPQNRDGYLEQLLQSSAFAARPQYCGHPVVNALLSSKKERLEELQVDAKLQISVPASLPIADVDLCAVFGNILDNAIEACQKIPRSQRRFILSCRAEKMLFMLRAENSSPKTDADSRPSGLPATTKTDKGSHGLGLEIIQEIVDRYQGTLEIERNKDSFSLLLSIPLADQPKEKPV